MRKKNPIVDRDGEAKNFVTMYDLSDYDLSHFTPARFEFEAKAAQLNMRMPKSLLEAVKKRAKLRGIPYTRFIREVLERELLRADKPSQAAGDLSRTSRATLVPIKSTRRT